MLKFENWFYEHVVGVEDSYAEYAEEEMVP
jgi:hypothetical protein